jgi:hypothetical protein
MNDLTQLTEIFEADEFEERAWQVLGGDRAVNESEDRRRALHARADELADVVVRAAEKVPGAELVLEEQILRWKPTINDDEHGESRLATAVYYAVQIYERWARQRLLGVEARKLVRDDFRIGLLLSALCGPESLKTPEHVAAEIVRMIDAGELEAR